MVGLEELVRQWRRRALDVRAWASAEGAACAMEICADELETALRDAREELLKPQLAAEVSNYSARRLRELAAEGKLKNYGRRGAPLYRRGDLPNKPAREVGRYDADEDARRLATVMAGGGRSTET